MKKIIISLSVLCLVFGVTSASAITYSGFGGRPAYPRQDNPRTEDIFVHRLNPGDIQEEGIYIINNSDEEKRLNVYAADYIPSTDGGFACKQLSEDQTEVGSWISFGVPGIPLNINGTSEVTDDEDDDSEEVEEIIATGDEENIEKENVLIYTKGPIVVELQSGQKSLLPFLITVPKRVDVGEHDGCIFVQEAEVEKAVEQGINLQTRTGLRVAITIEGQISRNLILNSFDILSRDNGGRILHPVVQNTGNVSVDADVIVVTNNVYGSEYARHGGQYSIISGDTSEWNFELDPSFWGGWYESYVTVEYQTDTTAELGVKSGETITLSSEPQRFFMFPSLAALIIYIIILLTILSLIVLLILSIRRKKKILRDWVEYSVRKNDDIRVLARKHDVSWKLIVKVNKLKAPYGLEFRDVLLLPPEEKISPRKLKRRLATPKKTKRKVKKQ